MKKKIGLIVNPIAGIGGRVGLKGSDGEEILKKAKELHGKSESPARTVEALREILELRSIIELITYPNDMGEEEAKIVGFRPQVIGKIKKNLTTANDTKKAAEEMAELKVDLLLFAGGDGTARDIYEAIGSKLVVIGIPTGVKIHSAVYATSPRNAGNLAKYFLKTDISEVKIREAEVMDIDEDAFRRDKLSAKLYGYLKVPHEVKFLQGGKISSNLSEEGELDLIAREIVNLMETDQIYIMSTGTTIQSIMKKMGMENTLLGVDAICNFKLIEKDLNENQILSLIHGKKAKIIVTVIGGQGYIFGRGNQQISWKVIEQVGRENIIVVASKNKIISLRNKTLLVDTGNKKIDDQLSGYMQVVTGIGERLLVKVSS